MKVVRKFPEKRTCVHRGKYFFQIKASKHRFAFNRLQIPLGLTGEKSAFGTHVCMLINSNTRLLLATPCSFSNAPLAVDNPNSFVALMLFCEASGCCAGYRRHRIVLHRREFYVVSQRISLAFLVRFMSSSSGHVCGLLGPHCASIVIDPECHSFCMKLIPLEIGGDFPFF